MKRRFNSVINRQPVRFALVAGLLLVVVAFAFLYGSYHGAKRQKLLDARTLAAAHSSLVRQSNSRLTIAGTVTSISGNKLQIKTPADGLKTCVQASTTKVVALSHASGTAEGVQVGQRVVVTAVEDSQGTVTAQLIRIL